MGGGERWEAVGIRTMKYVYELQDIKTMVRGMREGVTGVW